MRPRDLLLIGAALFLMLCGPESGQTGPGGPIRTAREVRECQVQFPERRLLAAERIGILNEVFDEGTRVRSGQIVARLQDDVLRSALAVAEARATSDVAIRVARKEQEQAQAEYEAGLAANLSRMTYPEAELARRRLAAEAAALRIEEAEDNLLISQRLRDEAIAELNTSFIRSPIDGMVTLRIKHAGEALRQGDPVLEVINTDVVRIEGFVTLEALQQWRVGRAVDVYADLSSADEFSPVPADASRAEAGPYSGVIGFVDVSVQPLSRTVRVWAEVRNVDGQLRDGMTARMVLVE